MMNFHTNNSYVMINGRDHYKLYEMYSNNYKAYIPPKSLALNYIQICISVWDFVLMTSSSSAMEHHITYESIILPGTDESINNRFKNDMELFKNEVCILFFYQLLSLNLLDTNNKVPVEMYHKETTLMYHILGGYMPSNHIFINSNF